MVHLAKADNFLSPTPTISQSKATILLRRKIWTFDFNPDFKAPFGAVKHLVSFVCFCFFTILVRAWRCTWCRGLSYGKVPSSLFLGIIQLLDRLPITHVMRLLRHVFQPPYASNFPDSIKFLNNEHQIAQLLQILKFVLTTTPWHDKIFHRQ